MSESPSKYIGLAGLVLESTSFDYDPAAGWTQQATYSGTFEEIKSAFTKFIAKEAKLGNAIKADIKTLGNGNRAQGTLHYPDGEQSLGVGDTTTAQWSLDWSRKELAIAAAPMLRDLTPDQVQALNSYSRNHSQKRPYVAAGDLAGSCYWPPGAAAGASLKICNSLIEGTPAAMNDATEMIKRGTTQFVTQSPVLKKTSNFRAGAEQKQALSNIGKMFSTQDLKLEGFPETWGATLPCAMWLKASQGLKYSGLRLQIESTFEGFSSVEAALYTSAKKQTKGACCGPDNKCLEKTADECAALGFTFLGVDADCGSIFNPCKCAAPSGPAVGCCYFTNAAGDQDSAWGVTATQCFKMHGTFKVGEYCRPGSDPTNPFPP